MLDLTVYQTVLLRRWYVLDIMGLKSWNIGFCSCYRRPKAASGHKFITGHRKLLGETFMQTGWWNSHVTPSIYLHENELNNCAEESINQSVKPPKTNQPTNQPINQPANERTNQPTNEPINQSFNQSIKQPTNQSINQSINQWIKQTINHPMHVIFLIKATTDKQTPT